MKKTKKYAAAQKPSKVDLTKDTQGAKKTGIKMRGAGAATKGTMARGPMG